jgi:hypothetical protein
MRTDLGLPTAIEPPSICGVTQKTLTLYWFSESVQHFGSAAKTFRIETSGDGKVRERLS